MARQPPRLNSTSRADSNAFIGRRADHLLTTIHCRRLPHARLRRGCRTHAVLTTQHATGVARQTFSTTYSGCCNTPETSALLQLPPLVPKHQSSLLSLYQPALFAHAPRTTCLPAACLPAPPASPCWFGYMPAMPHLAPLSAAHRCLYATCPVSMPSRISSYTASQLHHLSYRAHGWAGRQWTGSWLNITAHLCCSCTGMPQGSLYGSL